MIGTVYKIEVNKEIYIGSTICKLNDRERRHNKSLRQNKINIKLYEECRKHNVEKIICITLKELEIENELEIRQLEQEYIDKLQPTLNSKLAYTGLTHKEYNKQDYIKNREHYLKQNKQYIEKNREHYLKKKRENYEKNKEELNDKKKVDVTCPICGFIGRKDKLNRHQKTKKCLESKELMHQEAP